MVITLKRVVCLEYIHPWSSHFSRFVVRPKTAYIKSIHSMRAWLCGVDYTVCRIAYSSPIWFDWSCLGTLRLEFLGSLSLNHMLLPACVVVLLLLMQDPLV